MRERGGQRWSRRSLGELVARGEAGGTGGAGDGEEGGTRCAQLGYGRVSLSCTPETE